MISFIKSKKYYFLLLAVFMVFALLISLLISVYYAKHVEDTIYQNLSSKASQKFEFQQFRLQERTRDIEQKLVMLRENHGFHAYLNHMDDADYLQENIDTFTNLLVSSPDVFQVRFIDADGNEKIRVDKDNSNRVFIPEHLQNKKNHYYFQQANTLENGEFFISNLDLNAEEGKIQIPYIPTLRIATPVFIGERRKGILIINLFVTGVFQPKLFEDFFDFYMVDEEGYFILHPEKEKSWSAILGTKQRYEQLFADATGIRDLDKHDYTYTYELEGLLTPVYLIARVKPSIVSMETTLQSRNIRQLTMVVLVFSVLMALLVSGMLSRLYQKLLMKNIQLRDALGIVDEHIIYSETDLHGVITDASSAFARISGYTKEELIGKPHNIIRHPDMPKETFEDLWDTIGQMKVWQGEVKNRRKDGSAYYVLTTIKPKYDDTGRFVGYISMRQNITKEKENQIQKEQLLYQSRHASMGEMISIIAHQWKQPLNHLSMELYNLYRTLKKEQVDVEKAKRHYHNGEKILLNLSEIISTFKEFFKPAGAQHRISLNEVLHSILLLVESVLDAQHVKVEIVNDAANVFVNGSENEIGQVFVNILKNSMDELQKREIGDPKITIGLENEDGQVIISICDNAGGVAQESLPKLFDPYFSTKGAAGTGIGLYMVRLIIEEKLKGKVSARNEASGLCTTITLPAAP